MEARENSEFLVFELSDTARANPLPLLTTAGLNGAPLTTTAQGVVPPVNVVSPNVRHIFKSGEWEWERHSIDGAEAAVKLAQEKAGASALAAEQSRAAAALSAEKAVAPTNAAIDQGIQRADIPGKVTSAVAAAPVVAAAAAAAVNAAPKIVELEQTTIPKVLADAKVYADASKWARPPMPATANFNDYNTPGVVVVASSNGKTNIPIPFAGSLEVTVSGSKVIQTFTTDEVLPRKVTRRLNAGTWGKWYAASSYSSSPPRGTDWDTVTEWGMYPINWIDHPNQPLAAVGVLEVMPSGADLLQRFTTRDNPTPRTVQRISTATGFKPWARVNEADLNALGGRVAALEATNTGGGGGGSEAPAPIGQWAPALTLRPAAEVVRYYSLDRMVGFNGSHSFGRLSETRDDGKTWTEIHKFDSALGWVQMLDNGELLASVGSDPNPREIWVSKGYGTGTTTWTKTLTGAAPYVYFANAWSTSFHKNIVILAEYGPKTPTYQGNAVTAYARYVYLSLDYGKTFRTIFDLGAYLTEDRKVPTAGQHMHGVLWDPYWDRIWVTFGDDTNGTVFSDDLGESWHTADWGSVPSAAGQHQAVGMAALPGAILFGSDGPPNGVWRIDRKAGKHKGTYVIEDAWTVPDDAGRLTHLCQSIHHIRQEGGPGVWLFGFGTETREGHSFIVATRDGFSFTRIWQDPEVQTAGLGIRSIAGPTLRGQLIVGSSDNRSSGWSEWRGPAPTY